MRQARQSLYHQHVNTQNRVIDFGLVRPNASVLVGREGADWVLRSLPVDADCSVELAADFFGAPVLITCEGGNTATITTGSAQPADGFWTLRLNGAAQYRWAASH
jgi:hypothetical protein